MSVFAHVTTTMITATICFSVFCEIISARRGAEGVCAYVTVRSHTLVCIREHSQSSICVFKRDKDYSALL